MIWLSEIILQQTRVAQGLPYFQKFSHEFPTVFDLAEANEATILRHWQGLGYYTRARNLHKCAKTVVDNYDGKFPADFEQLQRLEGVGKYTAAAIASFAFHQPVPVVDGNVYRVLSRVFGITKNIASGAGQKYFFQFSESLIDRDDPYHYNQAIMEFGATVCTPANPSCESCIFNVECFAFKNRCIQSLPVKSRKKPVKKRFFHYLVLKYGDKYLMHCRSSKDIWQRLYDFYLIELSKLNDFDQLMDHPETNWSKANNILLSGDSKIYTHILTHQKILAVFYLMEIERLTNLPERLENQAYHFFEVDEIENLPKPILIDNYLNEHIF